MHSSRSVDPLFKLNDILPVTSCIVKVDAGSLGVLTEPGEWFMASAKNSAVELGLIVLADHFVQPEQRTDSVQCVLLTPVSGRMV
jgi:hypothetical protein